MSENKRDSEISVEEWEQIVKELATPIDFDALIQAGVLERHGSGFKILKMNELPAYARKKITQMQTSSDGKPLVKFESSKKAEDLLKKHESRKK